MNRWSIARLVAAKDLRIERRSKVLTNQVIPFAGVTMVIFAFALDAKSARTDDGFVPLLELVAPGLVWLAALFSLLLLVQRSFAIEADDGALDALRVAGVDPVAIFWGKSAALAVQLAVLDVILLGAAVLLYGADVPAGGLVLLVVTLVVATCGLACVGTLYGGLTAGFSGRETLLPLLVLPVVAPVLIGATRAVESALGTGGVALSEGWPWIGLLTVFAIAFGVGGALAFGPLIDEAT
ncbi:MAG: heme exporter protein CcmB [Ilumatobacter sp.]|nr:heme exporter protein CcmB [Ilumatobacter sp.]